MQLKDVFANRPVKYKCTILGTSLEPESDHPSAADFHLPEITEFKLIILHRSRRVQSGPRCPCGISPHCLGPLHPASLFLSLVSPLPTPPHCYFLKSIPEWPAHSLGHRSCFWGPPAKTPHWSPFNTACFIQNHFLNSGAPPLV